MAGVHESLFDKRIVERNIARGLIKREDYEKHLKGLDSLENDYDLVEIRSAEPQAASSAVESENKAGERLALEPQSPTGNLEEIQSATGRTTPMHDFSGSVLDKPVELAGEASAPQPPMPSVNFTKENAEVSSRETTEITPTGEEPRNNSVPVETPSDMDDSIEPSTDS